VTSSPAGWKEVRLGDISEVKTGPFGSALHASDYVSQGTPIITVEHLGEFRLEGENAPLVGKKDVNRLSSYVLRHGDLVFSRVGSIGRFGYVEESQNGWLFSGRLLRLRTRQGHPRFLYFQMCSSKFINQILEVAVGQTMPSLNTVIVGNLKISLPPLKEQEAIAEALSDADAAIESLDALIAKKRDVKQATMQQLLAGRTRLPGFTADWKEVRLGEICELSLAASKKSRSDGRGKYIIADMGSVSKDGSFLTHKTTDVRDDVLRTGDLVMPKDDIGGGQIIGKAVLVDEDERYVLGDHVYRLRLSDGFPAFVRYGIKSYKVNIQLRSKVVGSAQLGLGRRAVLEQPISFPPLKEQEAIAETLSAMDDELEVLTEQAFKLRMVKQGMMQDLLTGKVRLV
jgi:type I restriction enzyme S subunit